MGLSRVPRCRLLNHSHRSGERQGLISRRSGPGAESSREGSDVSNVAVLVCYKPSALVSALLEKLTLLGSSSSVQLLLVSSTRGLSLGNSTRPAQFVLVNSTRSAHRLGLVNSSWATQFVLVNSTPPRQLCLWTLTGQLNSSRDFVTYCD